MGTREDVIEVKVRIPSSSVEHWRVLARLEHVPVGRVVKKVLMLGETELKDSRLVAHCYVCNRYKPRTEFFHDRSRPGGRESRCKVCSTARRKSSRERIS